MRLITLSFLKNCKLKTIYYSATKKYSNDTSQVPKETMKGDAGLVEVRASWPIDEEQQLRAAVLADMQVIPDFITEEEEAALLAELDPVLKKMRYEYDHWDNAIQGYRETERAQWLPHNAGVLQRVREAALRPGDEPLAAAHVLDLAAAGHIEPHVDAVRFCGAVIAGLCLASSAVMRLTHSSRPQLALDALLARRCLYIMRDEARYSFAHAVLGGAASAWRGERVRRLRRVAVICRTRPEQPEQPEPL